MECFQLKWWKCFEKMFIKLYVHFEGNLQSFVKNLSKFWIFRPTSCAGDLKKILISKISLTFSQFKDWNFSNKNDENVLWKYWSNYRKFWGKLTNFCRKFWANSASTGALPAPGIFKRYLKIFLNFIGIFSIKIVKWFWGNFNQIIGTFWGKFSNFCEKSKDALPALTILKKCLKIFL